MTSRRPTTPQGPREDTAWRGTVARWYDALVSAEGSSYQQDVIHPQTLRLLAPQKDERVLDLACGQGALCRLLLKRGVQAIGLDASEELIEAARRRSRSQGRYLVGDARRLTDTFPAESFDGVVCVLALQNMDPLEPVLTGCAEVLRPGGRLVLTMTHPCFRIPRQSAWGWDETRKLLYRRVDRYLSLLRIPIQTHPGADPSLVTWTFHRPLQSYVQGLTDAGLWVSALEEWPSERASQPGPRAKAENRARQEIPLFLALRAVKPGVGLPRAPTLSGNDGLAGA